VKPGERFALSDAVMDWKQRSIRRSSLNAGMTMERCMEKLTQGLPGLSCLLDHTNRIDQTGQTSQMDQPPTTRREMVYEDGLRSDLLE
jgi:hypothetical protein